MCSGKKERPPVVQSLQTLSTQTAQFELGLPQCKQVYPTYIHNLLTPTSSAVSSVLQMLQAVWQLNTKFLSRAVRSDLGSCYNAIYHHSDLRHLVDFSSRSICLELMKPLIQENDFIKVNKNLDGSLIIENACFKTRVRASKVEPVRHSDIASGSPTCIWTSINR